MSSEKPAPLTPPERAVVTAQVLYWYLRKWDLMALVVKPTHVHLVPSPLPAGPGQYFSLSEILHSVKHGSSRIINERRGRRGALWEQESYDHLIRDEAELEATLQYLLKNAAEEVPGGDAYAYDGFWCPGRPLPEGFVPPVQRPPPLARRPVNPRLQVGQFVQRERKLPHWEQAGSAYHVVISLVGYRPEAGAWPGASDADAP